MNALVCVGGLIVWLVISLLCAAWIYRPRRLNENWHDRNNTMTIIHADGQRVMYSGNRRAMQIDWDDVREIVEHSR